jgi:DNA (cytosine-5)-methyltransferase 1
MKQEIMVSSLFSGCGGLDLGFKQAGFKIIWANEIDKDAASTYSKFIDNNIIVEDIIKVINKIPKTDILIGGPPCQSFSLVGKRIDDDPRGKLVFAYLEAVAKVKPKVFLMENVPGLCASYFNNERLHIYLFKQLSKLGYEVDFLKLNSADFCVPQLRKRVFLIGQTLKANFRLFDGEEFTKKVLGFKRQTLPVKCKEALDDLPDPVTDSGQKLPYPNKKPSEYAQLMRERGKKDVTLHFVPTMSVKDKLFIKHIPPGGNYQNIPDEISTKRIMNFKLTGGRTTTYGRLHPDKPAYTLNTYFNRPNVGANYHYAQERLITPREGLRLQSFPDDFIPVYSSQRSLYKQIGNAVPPLMARGIAESIKVLFK